MNCPSVPLCSSVYLNIVSYGSSIIFHINFDTVKLHKSECLSAFEKLCREAKSLMEHQIIHLVGGHVLIAGAL